MTGERLSKNTEINNILLDMIYFYHFNLKMAPGEFDKIIKYIGELEDELDDVDDGK